MAIPPPRPPREPRLDIVRGLLQIFIFASHSAGTFAGAWLIHGSWGLSDSSEQFLFMSGFVLGSLFVRNALRKGYGAALRDFLKRTFRLYRTHLVAFALFALMVMAAERLLPLPGEVEGYGFTWLFAAPVESLPSVLALLYRPTHMDILPIFIWSMLLLPGFLWLMERVGAAALALPLGIYAGVQLWGWSMPAPGHPSVGFNPLAWQVMFFLGAALGRRALLTGARLRPVPLAVAGAMAMVAIGLWFRLIDYGWVPGPEVDLSIVMDKQSLAPARVLHALALAYLVAVFVPREAPWMANALASAVAVIGRHSLEVFCVGLFLAWGIGTMMEASSSGAWWPGVWWMEPPLLLGGAILLWRLAVGLERRRKADARHEHRLPMPGAYEAR